MARFWFCYLLVTAIALVVLFEPVSGHCGQHSAQEPRAHGHGGYRGRPADARYSRGQGAMTRRQPYRQSQQGSHVRVADDSHKLSLVGLSQVVVSLCHQGGGNRMLTGYLQEMSSPRRLQQASGKELSRAAYGISGVTDSYHGSHISPVIVTMAGFVEGASSQRLRSWNMQDLSMLASTFNTRRQLPGLTDALKTIAGEVARRGAGFRSGERWPEQAVVSLVNIFSTLEGTRARYALHTLADEVIGQRASYRNKHGSTITPLVIIANGFGKAEGEIIQAVLKEIAQKIVADDGELIDRDKWLQHDLAMMANALGKAEGHRINRALKAIARAIASGPEALAALRHWSSRHLSNAAIGISKNARDDDVARALRAIAEVVVGHPRLGESQQWSEQGLAMVASGLSKTTGTVIQQALGRIAAEVVRRGGLTNPEVWTHLHLAAMASAIVRAEQYPAVTETLILIAGAMVHRAQELQDKSKWQAKDLSLAANAISHVNHETATEALVIVAGEVVRRGASLHRRSEWTPSSLSMIACAFGRIPGEPVYQALRLMARELVKRSGELYNRDIWRVLDLVNFANAIGKVPVDDAIAEALKTLADVVADREERLHDPELWRIRDLSLMSNALTKVEGERVTRAINSIAAAVYERRQALEEQQPRGIQNLVVLAASLNKAWGEPVVDALRAIAEVVARQGSELENRAQWSPQNLARMAQALAKIPGSKAVQPLSQIAAVSAQWLSEPDGQQPWSVIDLGTLVGSIGLSSCAGAFEQLAGKLLALRSHADELAWILIGMGRWHLLDSHLRVASKMFQALVDLDFHFHKLDLLEELMWVATIMDYRNRQSEVELPVAGRPFADAFQRYHQQYQQLYKTLEAAGASIEDAKGWEEYQWHGLFARDYWQESVSAPRIEQASSVELQRVSSSQKYLFKRLKHYFPDSAMETRINGFPVDIMVGSDICVEMDGPLHFSPCEGDSVDDLGCRLSKDRLINHMLGHYHCRVVRIPYTALKDEGELQGYITQIASLRTAAKP